MKTGLYGILFPSGKWYWGEGIYANRQRTYKSLNCKKQRKLYRALKKYGYDNTKRVFYPMPKYMAELLEPEYIAFYDSFHNGYNCNEGGGSGYRFSDETKAKMSKAQKGKVMSDEAKDKISKANKGREGHHKNLGQKRSNETREKMRQAKIGHVPWNKGVPMKAESKEKMRKNLSISIKKWWDKRKADKAKQEGCTPLLI